MQFVESFDSIRITMSNNNEHWIIQLYKGIHMNTTFNYTPRYSPKELKKIENIHIQNKVSSDFIELKLTHNYKLFHLTITWNKTHLNENPKYLNNDLNTLYRLFLVKYASNVNRISKNNRHIQPIFVSFIDEGNEENKSSTSNCQKLHHHCLIAAIDKTAERLESICGENTIKPMCQRLDELYPRKNLTNAKPFQVYDAICTTDMKLITNDEIQTRYASKTLYKFDEESMMMFNYPIDYKTISSPMSEVVSDYRKH